MNTKRRTVSSPPTVHGPLQPSVVRRLSSVFRHSMLGVGRWALGVCFSPRLVFRRLSLVHSLQSTTSPRCGASGHLASDVAAYSLRSGFTLIELLVVIVVIAILMGITLPVSKYAIYRAKAARQVVMLAKIRSALDDYRATYGEYPITPMTNDPSTWQEAGKHYWDNLTTNNYSVLTNWLTPYSPSTNISLANNTVETSYWVDYSLTFPLMIRPMIEGKNPFYRFPDVTVASVVYKRWSGDVYTRIVKRKGGAITPKTGLRGAQVNRPKAIDPVSMKQWKYECYDGMSYTLTTNTF